MGPEWREVSTLVSSFHISLRVHGCTQIGLHVFVHIGRSGMRIFWCQLGHRYNRDLAPIHLEIGIYSTRIILFCPWVFGIKGCPVGASPLNPQHTLANLSVSLLYIPPSPHTSFPLHFCLEGATGFNQKYRKTTEFISIENI